MRKFWERLNKFRHRFRLSIFDSKNLTEVYRVTLSRFQGMGIIGSVWGSGVLVTLLLIFFTPLKQCVPGYPREKFQKEVIEAALKLDSLESQIAMRDSFLNIIKGVILGNINDSLAPSVAPKRTDSINFTDLKSDDVFNELVGAESIKYGSMSSHSETADLSLVNFFPPVKGIVTNNFNMRTGHFAVDVVGKEKAPVFATLSGTVIFAEWSVATGNVVVIQHEFNLISIYKHNSELRVKAGETVKAGKLIAIVGNTGELSVGPHLHFELWQDGKPIDPEQYVLFDGI